MYKLQASQTMWAQNRNRQAMIPPDFVRNGTTTSPKTVGDTGSMATRSSHLKLTQALLDVLFEYILLIPHHLVFFTPLFFDYIIINIPTSAIHPGASGQDLQDCIVYPLSATSGLCGRSYAAIQAGSLHVFCAIQSKLE